jgi:raffinose/stachyose/melibiose transport system permease protein
MKKYTGDTRLRVQINPFYFVIPALSLYIIFFITPILLNVGAAFTDWSSYHREISFAGLKNFKRMIENGDLLHITKNTILFTITVVTLQNIFGFLLALALKDETRLNGFLRALLFYPAIVAIVVWGYLFQTILHPTGLFNKLLSFVFVQDISIAWLGDIKYTIFVVGFVNTWMWTGFSMMIYVAAINAISPSIMEAGEIDGLRPLGMIRHIIIPLIIPGVTTSVLISTVGSLKVFDIIMVLTKGGPGNATHVFNTWIYETFGQGLLGYASAMNIFLIVFISIIAFPIYQQLSKRVVEA